LAIIWYNSSKSHVSLSPSLSLSLSHTLFAVYFYSVHIVTSINLRKCKTIAHLNENTVAHLTSRKGLRQVYKYYILVCSRQLSGRRIWMRLWLCKDFRQKLCKKILFTVQRTAYDSAPNHEESRNARERTFFFLSSSWDEEEVV